MMVAITNVVNVLMMCHHDSRAIGPNTGNNGIKGRHKHGLVWSVELSLFHRMDHSVTVRVVGGRSVHNVVVRLSHLAVVTLKNAVLAFVLHVMTPRAFNVFWLIGVRNREVGLRANQTGVMQQKTLSGGEPCISGTIGLVVHVECVAAD